jgi:hypothetical protein
LAVFRKKGAAIQAKSASLPASNPENRPQRGLEGEQMKRYAILSLALGVWLSLAAFAQDSSSSPQSQDSTSSASDSSMGKSSTSSQASGTSAQGASSSSDASSGAGASKAKLHRLKGTIGQDGTTFTSDKDQKSWTIMNPEAVKGHEGHHVRLKAHVYPDKNQIHVMSLKMAKESKEKSSGSMGGSMGGSTSGSSGSTSGQGSSGQPPQR